MESYSTQKEKPRYEISIEGQSNFEGSWTNLMIERLRNPEIKKQIVDLIFEVEQDADGALYEKARLDDSGAYKKYGERYSFIEDTYVARTREQIEKDFEEDLEMVSRYTPITFDLEDENGMIYPRVDAEIPEGREILPVNMIHPLTGKKNTDRVLNITEAHEKGHVLRQYCYAGSRKNGHINSNALDAKFQNAFDFERIESHVISYKDKEKYKNSERKMERLREEQKNRVVEYLKHPIELAERMSQLKNYFGMKGHEKFTKEHLLFAKKYYIEDTGQDDHMSEFFQAITPEKEDAFIELINSAGI